MMDLVLQIKSSVAYSQDLVIHVIVLMASWDITMMFHGARGIKSLK